MAIKQAEAEQKCEYKGGGNSRTIEKSKLHLVPQWPQEIAWSLSKWIRNGDWFGISC